MSRLSSKCPLQLRVCGGGHYAGLRRGEGTRETLALEDIDQCLKAVITGPARALREKTWNAGQVRRTAPCAPGAGQGGPAPHFRRAGRPSGRPGEAWDICGPDGDGEVVQKGTYVVVSMVARTFNCICVNL